MASTDIASVIQKKPKSLYLTVRVDEDVYSRILDRADIEGYETLSEWVRAVLSRELAEPPLVRTRRGM